MRFDLKMRNDQICGWKKKTKDERNDRYEMENERGNNIKIYHPLTIYHLILFSKPQDER